MESGTAALLVASSPIWMVLLDAVRLRRAPSGGAVAGIVLGSAGIALLVGRTVGHADALMACLILIGSLSWALGSVYARATVHHPLTASLEMLLGGALSIIVGLAVGEVSHLRIHAISFASLVGMLWLIFGGAMLGYSAYAYVVRALPTPTVATCGYVNPVVAVILGAIVLREPVTWNIVAGGATVIASIALILIGSRRPEQEEPLLTG